MELLVILAIVGAVAAFAIYLYNNLVRMRQMAQEGWSGIDVQLKRRADLIPNLLESVKGYMGHEKSVLEEVTRMRTAAVAASNADPAERGKVEGALSAALGRFMAVAENYPDLKASTNFVEFQQALAKTEDEIGLARRYYNGAARNLNIAVESFPSNLVASRFGFSKMDFFEIEDEVDRAVPKVSFN